MAFMWFIWIALILITALGFFLSGAVGCLILEIIIIVFPLLAIAINILIPHKPNIRVSFSTLAKRSETLCGNIFCQSKNMFTSFAVAKLNIKNRLTLEETTEEYILNIWKHKNHISIDSEFCGKVTLKITEIRFYDLFHLTYKTVKTDQSFDIIFMTNICEGKDEIYNKYENSDIQYSLYKSGNDISEVFEFSEYKNGDDIRLINWKLSEKYDRLIIKRGSMPEKNDTLIMMKNVFKEKAENIELVMNDLAETIISASSELAERNIPHRIGFYSCDDGEVVFCYVDSIESLIYATSKILSSGYLIGDDIIMKDYMNLE